MFFASSPARWVAAAAAGACLLALLIAYFFMEKHLLLEPCPLCILDRFAVGVAALGFAGIAMTQRRIATWLCWGLTTLGLAAGWLFATRHIWLQNRPPEVSASCLADNAAASGLVELVRDAFAADADCGAIMWEFAGLTIPEQVLGLLVVLTLVHGYLARALYTRHRI